MNLTNLIIILLFNACFIVGLYKIVGPGMILGFVSKIVNKLIDNWPEKTKGIILKPLISCPPCMSSVWGTLFFFGWFGFGPWLIWPAYCIALAGLVTLLMRIANYEI